MLRGTNRGRPRRRSSYPLVAEVGRLRSLVPHVMWIVPTVSTLVAR
jgi:hypothetical protein